MTVLHISVKYSVMHQRWPGGGLTKCLEFSEFFFAHTLEVFFFKFSVIRSIIFVIERDLPQAEAFCSRTEVISSR